MRVYPYRSDGWSLLKFEPPGRAFLLAPKRGGATELAEVLKKVNKPILKLSDILYNPPENPHDHPR